MQYLNTENYKTLRKIKDLNKKSDTPFSWFKSQLLRKTSVFPKLVYRFSAFPIKNLSFFKINKLTPKFIWNCRAYNNQNNLAKLEDVHYPIF